ncbi:CPBP family intramembrane metalloprotease [Maribacter litopenaei]|uniref:CPBP family intramembrane metalloprotease n=1 Tax=Maribacter litopenaei TaxID=2976127 RepID=A0ABY5YBP3_9FLAO|nr:CPBP family intramembrane glutamic endopeptidase [Maribacter litopenaei]UWX56344.1 CPBP family intramembrane metalloprotease [Maribacter litopenaei]
MKPFLKAILFLIILTILDFFLRKGLIAFYIPFQLPHNLTMLILFTLFALSSWLVTKWFCKTDKITLHDLGISLKSKNRLEFYYGLLIGIVLWAIVSILQSYIADFSWELRQNVSLYNILYGLLFIFIADLGTELFTRGYPLKSFEKSFGANAAIIIMMFFVGLKSYSNQVAGELLLYTILIPVLHTIFFSIIYFKTNRLGAALGIHTGANFITISIFDLRPEQENQAIPSGIFQSNVELENLSLASLQLPWVFMALLFSIFVYLWWKKDKRHHNTVNN